MSKQYQRQKEKWKQEGWMLGLKAGLEVAKDICKKEGYEFSFPNPGDIKIVKDQKHKGGIENGHKNNKNKK